MDLSAGCYTLETTLAYCGTIRLLYIDVRRRPISSLIDFSLFVASTEISVHHLSYFEDPPSPVPICCSDLDALSYLRASCSSRRPFPLDYLIFRDSCAPVAATGYPLRMPTPPTIPFNLLAQKSSAYLSPIATRALLYAIVLPLILQKRTVCRNTSWSRSRRYGQSDL